MPKPKQPAKVETVYQWSPGVVDNGKFIEVLVPANIQVGNRVTICTSREYKKQDVVGVSNHLIMVRSDDGYTVTLLRYNPNAVDSDKRGTRYKKPTRGPSAGHKDKKQVEAA